MKQVTFTNYIEIKCLNIPFTKICKNLNRNYIPCDRKSTTYMVFNDVMTNSFKLHKNRIMQGNIVCCKCLNIDTVNSLHLVIDDPEELFIMTLDKKGETGLWFGAAAIHYNVASFSDGSLNKFQAIVRSKRCSNRKNLKPHFGNLLNIF
jgi:hypothetical protein